MRVTWLTLFLPSRRTLRLSAYLLFVFSCGSALAAGAVYAQAKDAALAFGQQLRSLSELGQSENVILLNAERLHRAMAVSEEGVEQVLDRVQAECERSTGAFGQAVQEAVREHPRHFAKHKLSAHFLNGIVRDSNERRGMVACFVDGRTLGVRGFAEAASRFASSSELGEFGRFRYAFAEKAKSGKTSLTLLWADTGLNLSQMFPAEGDAAGEDSRVLPRAPHTRRTLSAAAEGAPYALRLYESSTAPRDLLAFYATWARQNGYTLAGRNDEESTLSYLRPDGYQVFITALAGSDEKTSLSLLEAGLAEGSLATVEVK